MDALLSKSLDETDSDIAERLMERTEGWPAGVLLYLDG